MKIPNELKLTFDERMKILLELSDKCDKDGIELNNSLRFEALLDGELHSPKLAAWHEADKQEALDALTKDYINQIIPGEVEKARREVAAEVIKEAEERIPCIPDLQGHGCDQPIQGNCGECKYILDIINPLKAKYLSPPQPAKSTVKEIKTVQPEKIIENER